MDRDGRARQREPVEDRRDRSAVRGAGKAVEIRWNRDDAARGVGGGLAERLVDRHRERRGRSGIRAVARVPAVRADDLALDLAHDRAAHPAAVHDRVLGHVESGYSKRDVPPASTFRSARDPPRSSWPASWERHARAVTLDTVRADVAAGQGHLIATVPFIPQEAYQCGPAALAMVLRYWGAAADRRGDRAARSTCRPPAASSTSSSSSRRGAGASAPRRSRARSTARRRSSAGAVRSSSSRISGGDRCRCRTSPCSRVRRPERGRRAPLRDDGLRRPAVRRVPAHLGGPSRLVAPGHAPGGPAA